MQIKTTKKYHFTTTRVTIIKKSKTVSNVNDVTGLEPSYSAGGNVIRCSHFVQQSSGSSVTIKPNNSIPRYLSKRNENTCPHSSYINVYGVRRRKKKRCSRSGTTGLAASWECGDEGSIPSLAQWVKDLALPQLIVSDPWPGNSICLGAAKYREKRKVFMATSLVLAKK